MGAKVASVLRFGGDRRYEARGQRRQGFILHVDGEAVGADLEDNRRRRNVVFFSRTSCPGKWQHIACSLLFTKTPLLQPLLCRASSAPRFEMLAENLIRGTGQPVPLSWRCFCVVRALTSSPAPTPSSTAVGRDGDAQSRRSPGVPRCALCRWARRSGRCARWNPCRGAARTQPKSSCSSSRTQGAMVICSVAVVVHQTIYLMTVLLDSGDSNSRNGK